MLVTTHLPGVLVEGHEAEADARALAWLDQPHRIAAATDLARLAARQFRGRPELERAFLEGYGKDPRTPESWRLIRIREALAG